MDAAYKNREKLRDLAGIFDCEDKRLVIGGQCSDPDDCIVVKNNHRYFIGSINGSYGDISHEELFELAKQTRYSKLSGGLQVFASVLGKEELQRLAKHELADAYYRAVKEIYGRDDFGERVIRDVPIEESLIIKPHQATSLKELSTILKVPEDAMKIVLDELVHCGDIEHTGDEILRGGASNPLYCAIEGGHHGIKAVELLGHKFNFYGVYKI